MKFASICTFASGTSAARRAPGCTIGADLDRLVADDAIDRRADLREGQVALGLVDRRLQLGGDALRLGLLRAQHLDIGLRRRQRGLGALHGGFGAVAVGLGLVEARLAGEVGLGKLLLALVIGLRARSASACAASICAAAWATEARAAST